MLLLCTASGAASGFVWEWLWTPPSGVVVDGGWVLAGDGLPEAFSGTGLFVVVAGLTGLGLGVLGAVARTLDRRTLDRHAPDERVTLTTLALGAALATATMWLVGTQAGPPDPAVVARSAEAGQSVPSDLRVEGLGAFLSLPAGTLVGATGVYLLVGRREPDRRDRPGPDEPGPSGLNGRIVG